MDGQRKEHWEGVYGSRPAEEMSWFQAKAATSLRLIRETGMGLHASVIDVGGGASILVDDLQAAGYDDLTVLDLSGAALEAAKHRLGSGNSGAIRWIEADITEVGLAADAYDIWHDRAVFHFLTSQTDRRRYVETMRRAIRPGGWAIVATFAEEGPERCSGLPVVRYSPESLAAELGAPFVLRCAEHEAHTTPAGAVQQFLYAVFLKPVD